ncbi:MAG: dihydrofolate reductase [Solirubrobacteraceae bacterium]|nr:dihydrofolate reductase [Solirubrobacteraceae bacterium]
MPSSPTPFLVLTPREVNRAAVAAHPELTAVPYDPASPIATETTRQAHGIIVQTEHVTPTLQLLQQLPQLQLVQTLSAGVDLWDGNLPAGVQLSNARGAHGQGTAELVMAMLLAHVRELREFMEDQAGHDWATRVTDSLHGKRVLILGAGDLAGHLQAMLAPFGASTTLVGRTAREGVISLAGAREMLPQTDAVVAVLPHTPQTRHLIDAEFLAALPDGAIVINAGRGPIVDTPALLAELQSRRLRAGLDVTDPEPLPADHPLWDAPGLILTPHVGGDTLGNEERSAQVAAEQLAQFARSGTAANLIHR